MKGLRICESRAGLASITEADTDLVIWQRSLPCGLQSWIDQTDAADLPEVRILVKPGELWPALKPLLKSCGLRADDRLDQLVGDINDLVIEFADITRDNDVDVRLERISHDACWKFHRDSVKTRLLTTYRGPTTEWVRHAHAEQAIRKQREFEGPIEHLGNADVAIFKGSCTSPDRGIVHRSPPVDGTGFTRLLLCLNQRTATSPEPWAEASKH